MNSPDYSRVRIAIHGGAGDLPANAGPQTAQRAELERITARAQQMLLQGASALDAVTYAVEHLEDCPMFNAGIGGVLNRDGAPELDAAIMRGLDRGCGAVAGIARSRSPVRLARAVMEQSPHVLFSGAGAELFGREQGLPSVEPAFFITEHRRAQLRIAQEQGVIVLDHDTEVPPPAAPDAAFGTVGAVARDAYGELAAATSTGGLTNKRPGRVGDTPLPGIGTFADNRSLAVSCTGTGEAFIKACFGYDVHARMVYARESLIQATAQALAAVAQYQGCGGCIAIDADGRIHTPFNSKVMFRAWALGDGAVRVGVQPEDGLGGSVET